MKTNIFLLLVCVFFITSWGQEKTSVQNLQGQIVLFGETTISDFQNPYFASWYNQYYSNYKPDKSIIKKFSKKLKKHQITIFFGSWCGDSKRQVPKMLKILKSADFPQKNLKLIGVNYQKKADQKQEIGKDIRRVPTFIIYKKGKEIGRIVETPKESLEKDLLKILDGQTYTPNYYTPKK